MGQDLILPTQALLLSDGDKGSLTLASQRFYHILRVTTSAGEHEKVVQVPMLTPALTILVLTEDALGLFQSKGCGWMSGRHPRDW